MKFFLCILFFLISNRVYSQLNYNLGPLRMFYEDAIMFLEGKKVFDKGYSFISYISTDSNENMLISLDTIENKMFHKVVKGSFSKVIVGNYSTGLINSSVEFEILNVGDTLETFRRNYFEQDKEIIVVDKYTDDSRPIIDSFRLGRRNEYYDAKSFDINGTLKTFIIKEFVPQNESISPVIVRSRSSKIYGRDKLKLKYYLKGEFMYSREIVFKKELFSYS